MSKKKTELAQANALLAREQTAVSTLEVELARVQEARNRAEA